MNCDNEYETLALTVEEAQQTIIDSVDKPLITEQRPVKHTLNRVLAEDLVSSIDIPPHTNSAMDGYAVRAKDINTDTCTLRLIGESLAGNPYQGRTLQAGECIRITTGAVMPEGADTVIMLEDTEFDTNNTLTIHKQPQLGQHIRRPGEDIQQGSTVLRAGKRLMPADLGVINACGIREVSVFRQPKVAFFSTGDELRQAGEPLGLGDIYDSNRFTLYGMLTRAYCDITDLGVVADDQNKLRDAFAQASQSFDMVISTGGVSVGAADHIKSILAEFGQPQFWRIAMKPGRPLTFGRINKALFFGLPGNPVSVMATFYLFVLPALKRLDAETDYMPLKIQAALQHDLKKRPGRTDFQRGYLNWEESVLSVATVGQQQSHILSSMSHANCFIELPRHSGNLSAGDIVTVIPFYGLV